MKRLILALLAAAALGGCIKMDKTPPKDMPAYVKLYPGATQMMSMNIVGMEADVVTTTAAPDDVIAFYRTQAATDGLTETAAPPSASAQAGDKQVAFTGATPDQLLVVMARRQSGATGMTMVTVSWKAPTKAPS
ncbi:MAG TPA: hypothetical protein VN814_14100 [Caulobacteraceae bacterium]|nr:hypothetical protein [Caulobacteraceae bacterium]